MPSQACPVASVPVLGRSRFARSFPAHLGPERLLGQLLPQAAGAGLAAAGREGLIPPHRGGVDVLQTAGGSPQRDRHLGAPGSLALSEFCLLPYILHIQSC